jgi:homocysteine S-methyltransferase
MDGDQAAEYHAPQVATLAGAGVDLVTALTLTNTAEAIGVVRAASGVDVPVVISFTVETDGRLPDGTRLRDAIAEVDDATGAVAAYYMVNCAHPDHFAGVLDHDDDVLARIRGLRVNASRLSHAELDDAEELDDGDPTELGAQLADLSGVLPDLRVLGGCCGTDHRHVAATAAALARR